MTNTERANKWYKIITRLIRIEKSTVSFKTWMLASHYRTFATEMWMMHVDKVMKENFKPFETL